MRTPRWKAGFVAALLAACSAQLEVPEDARLTCTAGSECPEGRLCVNGWCVDAASADTTPPDLAGAPVVSPTVGKAGAAFTVELTASEPLSEPPRVTLALDAPVELACVESSATTWRCSYAATGAENGGLGGIAPFDVRLVDAAGNVAVRRLAGAIQLDFAPPALAASSLSPAAARLGVTLQAFFATSEPLAGVAVLRIDPPLSDGLGGTIASVPLVASEGTLNHLFEHEVIASDPAGAVAFSVEVTDVAGNAATLPLGSVGIDAVAPVVGPLTVTPARIDETGDVTVQFDVSEPPATLHVTVGGRETWCLPWSDVPPNCTCLLPMMGDEIAAGAEEAQAVLAEARDAAGNLDVASGVVVFDFRPPAVASVARTYVPAATNPLPTVTAATVGTTARITVIADEAIDLGRPMTLSAATEDGLNAMPFALDPGSVTPTGATFEAVIQEGAVAGDYVPVFGWSDLAGNATAATLEGAGIRVATVAPGLQVGQSLVTYLRIPMGYSEPQLLGVFEIPPGAYHALAPGDPLDGAATLPGNAFSLDPGGTTGMDATAIRLWDRPVTEANPTLLATVFRNPDGSWPRAPVPFNLSPTLWVTALDPAGNESSGVAIESVEWVATSNPPAYGSSPHVVEASVYAPRTLAPDPQATSDVDGASLAGLSSSGFSTFAAAADPVLRRRFAPGARPPARSNLSLTWDPVRGNTVLYGGIDASSAGLSDTWEWDGVAWRERTPPAANLLAAWNNVAFDGAVGRVVGINGGYFVEWDGVAWTTGRGGSGPSWTLYGYAAWDSVRERMVWLTPAVGSPQTWEWDGAQWTLFEDAPFPEEREGAAVAFDAARGRAVLYGGYDVHGGVVLGDLWEWNGAAWTQILQTGDLPGPRAHHALVPDPAGAGVLLIGGNGSLASIQRTIHRWDGETWTDLTPAAGAWPVAFRDFGAATDLDRGRVVLFGGYDDTFAKRDETWEWDGAGWVELTEGSTPLPRGGYGSAMAYDAERHRVVMYGGFTGDGVHSEAWEFDGARWADVSPAVGPVPAPRAAHALAWDSVAKRVVLFGGMTGTSAGWTLLNDTWDWSGGGWTQRPVAAAPPVRKDARLAYDPSRGALVLFGGDASPTTSAEVPLGDTWELTDEGGTWTWTRRADPPPAALLPATRPAICFDGARTILADNSRIWGWDGGVWTQLAQPTLGSMPAGQTVWDSVRRRAVTLGWDYLSEWDGAAWRHLWRPDRAVWPTLNYAVALAFDEARGRSVLQGSSTAVAEVGTWELDADLAPGAAGPIQKREPAVQLTAAYAGAGFEVPTLPAPFEVTGLRVRARAGGTFGATGTGARLVGWKRSGLEDAPSGWVTLDTNDTPSYLWQVPFTEGGLSWEAAPDEVHRYFLEGDRKLAFQVRPAGRSAPADPGAIVNADFLEVRVRYTKRY